MNLNNKRDLTIWLNQQARKRRKTLSIPEQVRSILNKYGATMLLPGVSGVLRFGYQPGNYRESTGQTLAAADQQVGLVVDAAKSPGPELVSNPGPFADTTGWVGEGGTLSAAGGALVLTSTGAGFAARGVCAVSTVANRLYEVTLSAGPAASSPSVRVGTTSGGTQLFPTTSFFANSVYRFVFTATGATAHLSFVGSATANATATLNSISVRELPGIHASQSTSGFQPVLRNTSGIQSWQFDGTDDRLSLSAVPFQMADDHFVVAGATAGALGSTRTIFNGARSSLSITPIVGALRIRSDGGLEALWRNDANAITWPTTSAGTVAVGTPFVAANRKTASGVVIRCNGQQLASALTPSGATTVDLGAIGASVYNGQADFLNGHIHGVIFGKGAISDSELLTLEKFMATLQGRAI